jgi:hydrogenase maturation protease
MTADRVLVLGVGNDLLGDDAAGLLVAGALDDGGLPAGATVEITTRSGLALLDAVAGFRKVLLIDTQVSGRTPGSVQEYTLTASVVRSPSTHYLGYGEALALGAATGLDLPEEIHVLAVERTPTVTIGDDLSDPVRNVLQAVADRAKAIVHSWAREEAA